MDPQLDSGKLIRSHTQQMNSDVDLFPSYLNRFCEDYGFLLHTEEAPELMQPKSEENHGFLFAVAPKFVRKYLDSFGLDVKSLNSFCWNANISYNLHNSKNMNGEEDLEARELASNQTAKQVYDDTDDDHGRHSPKYTSFRNSMTWSRNVMLLIATVLATITYQVPSHLLGRTSDQQDLILSREFLFFNSIVFVASVVESIFLLHEFPMKPLPQISISALFGSYMFSIKEISPNEVQPLLLISIIFLLLAAAAKLFGFATRRRGM